MIKIMIQLVVFALSASVVFAEDIADGASKLKLLTETSEVQQFKDVNIVSVDRSCIALLKDDTLGRRGCCSHHSGVCGCSGGTVVCCDDSYSPTCTCRSNGEIQD